MNNSIVQEDVVGTQQLVEEQRNMPLFNALVNYANAHALAFDVPGHKMGMLQSPLSDVLGEMTMRMDVNSMQELDLLSHPQSVIGHAQQLAAQAFSADEAFFLVNGTTVGILAMIMAVCAPGDSIILPRNAHRSVIDGLMMSGAKPIFVQPVIDERFGIAHGVSELAVKDALYDHPQAKVLLLCYPSYFGSMSQLAKICQLAHEQQVTVIVDAAHGAHLGFMNEDFLDVMMAGADMATVSMHKTGGSLTQSSMLLVNNTRVNSNHVKKILNMLQTTSANYLLMSSLDVARQQLVLHGREHFKRLKPLVEKAIATIESAGRMEVLKESYMQRQFAQNHDWTKLVIRVNDLGMTGFDVYAMLKTHYNIQVELAESYVIVAVISMADDDESLHRLVAALKDVEKKAHATLVVPIQKIKPMTMNEVILSPREAFYAEQETIAITASIGRISADSLMIYPPGIPLVIPGEMISQKVIDEYFYYCQNVGDVLIESQKAHHISVIKEMG
ncbi:aminotransferase class I/II-fold pyridoxal phosphate-dependent enzyme [Kurthia sibirica]|uniref:Decarboxylase n=1 Tax=Kurthia sibirica TaxID=202750 RepID=A0A2U3ALB2_9BACL|nr:aminotransferase class I/II-fold pyridoxal phosphate-dependent enzyme [Kurthia sibirica]PWI25321.1 decarboxylase [Kurthia sibirica]GEK34433.1 lysine decarboxylase [Kurthia sibirica]